MRLSVVCFSVSERGVVSRTTVADMVGATASLAREEWIAAYWLVVAQSSWSSAVLLFVDADARVSK